ncbi:uncharacterized protein LOC126703786 [Quercus robur]|uniref:uncharacterized protein LOC126703786 n=1 Tax=Quercus robur TaxID=38942 RepID=UPI00216139B5|nr:uncharacterized protein LOC126703786 [Quercus robur]
MRHFNEPSLPLDNLLDAAKVSLAEFESNLNIRPEKPKTVVQHWKPPMQDTYKVNYDDACFTKTDEAGIGVVVRNELGQVMTSLTKKIPMPLSVEVLKAKAVRRAMIITTEWGFHRAIFEGDSELVVKALFGDSSHHSCIGHIAKDCKSIMSFFQTCSFSHVRQQSNRVAHTLAKRARKSFPLSVWMKSVPPDISYIIYVDVTP